MICAARAAWTTSLVLVRQAAVTSPCWEATCFRHRSPTTRRQGNGTSLQVFRSTTTLTFPVPSKSAAWNATPASSSQSREHKTVLLKHHFLRPVSVANAVTVRGRAMSPASRMGSHGPAGHCQPVQPRPSPSRQCLFQLPSERRSPYRKLEGHSTFKPGDLLSDHVLSFVWSDKQTNNLTVTSHVEKLSQSLCQQSSGTRLWCGSCHLRMPSRLRSVSNITARSVWPAMKTPAAKARPKCEHKRPTTASPATCPRARPLTSDIPCSPTTPFPGDLRSWQQNSRLAGTSLRAFGTAAASSRDLGLAYAEIATGQKNAAFAERSFESLKVVEGTLSNDAPALLQLAFLYDGKTDRKKAIQLYRKALAADPSQVVALLNLGALLAQQQQFQEAISLWQDALSKIQGWRPPAFIWPWLCFGRAMLF